MKKVLIALLLVSIPVSVFAKSSYLEKQLRDVDNNVEYSTVKKYQRSYQSLNLKTRNIQNLKDPKLIASHEFSPVSDADYKAKVAKDEEVYKRYRTKLKNTNDVDYYNVYRVAERLVRANNLDYVNWRVAVRKTVDKVNAYSSSGNFICIYTPLYDTLESNDDALAFVLAHEMAHLILGHTQREMEFAQRHNIQENSFAYLKAMKNSRTMEYMADSEAFILLYTAGYSPEKAMDALYALDVLPNVNSVYSSHPVTKKRIQSALENIAVLDPNWVEKGKYNLYNSKVLPAKKSADRVSFIMNKSEVAKDFYHPEDYTERLTRIAYQSYRNGNLEYADKMFSKLARQTGRYEHYLYLSYTNQYLYDFTQKPSYLKKAVSAAQKAYEKSPNNKYVKAQYDEVNGINL